MESASGYNLVLVLSLLKCQSSSSIFSLDISLLLQGWEETETFLKLLLFCVFVFFFNGFFFPLRFNSKQVAINAWPQYPIPQLLRGKKQVLILWILKSLAVLCYKCSEVISLDLQKFQDKVEEETNENKERKSRSRTGMKRLDIFGVYGCQCVKRRRNKFSAGSLLGLGKHMISRI